MPRMSQKMREDFFDIYPGVIYKLAAERIIVSTRGMIKVCGQAQDAFFPDPKQARKREIYCGIACRVSYQNFEIYRVKHQQSVNQHPTVLFLICLYVQA